MKIVFLSFFKSLCNCERMCSPACNNVSEYFKNVLIDNFDCEKWFINAAPTKTHHSFSKAKIEQENKNIFVLSPSFDFGKIYAKYVRPFFFWRWFYKFLRKNTNSDDVIIIYHSLLFLKLEKKLSKIRKTIIYVAEIYSDIPYIKHKNIKKELDSINSSNTHIFSSNSLKSDIRIHSSKFAILYGAYLPFFGSKRNENRKDGFKTMVFTGTLASGKGVDCAIDVMKYLPSNYALDIFGVGTREQKEKIRKRILNDNRIRLLEPLSETQLFSVLLNYNIGLVLQNPFDSFNASSFPSKIFTYLRSGLRVISTKSKAVVESPVAPLICFVDSESSDIAKLITNDSIYISSEKINSELNKMHNIFIKEIKELL